MVDNQHGGNIVCGHGASLASRTKFAGDEYEYYYLELKEGDALAVDSLSSYTVCILSVDGACKFEGLTEDLEIGDCIQCEGYPVSACLSGKSISLLVSGVRRRLSSEASVEHTKFKDLYKVLKPWGYELWLNGEHPFYAFKMIFLKKGFKTSLQYHKKKRETNVLFDGNIRLHYKLNRQVANDSVVDADIGVINLSSIASVDVVPGVLHRIEAVSDSTLYEVSTPHLDDVVRVADDSDRASGRISSEHPNLS